MYILSVQFNLTCKKVYDARNCPVMRENLFHEETDFRQSMFRNGKKALDERGFPAMLKIQKGGLRLHRWLIALLKIQKGGLRLHRWLIALLIFLLSLVVINTYNTGSFPIVRFGTMAQSKENTQEDYVQLKPIYPAPIGRSDFLIYNKGCRIPAMDPFDPAIKRFITKEKPLVCDYGDALPLIESNNTALFVNPLAWDEFYNKSEKISCCWRSFWRTKDQDNAITYDKICNPFQDSCTVNTEFVKVECYRSSKLIYKDYFAFLPRKSSVEDRCKQVLNADTSNDRLSILVIGLDSISRLNFHRMMPMTVKALQSLGAVEMLGYTKVADNTFPNLVPVLFGLNVKELQDVCWQSTNKTFDECPFLWKKYSIAGYRTIFGEDACGITTFNYLKRGFLEPPTDYYLRPYCIGAEHDIGNSNKLNANLCIGTRKNFDCLLHYARKTAVEFAAEPYFAFIWQSSLTHDYLTYPQLGDSSYRDFVEYVSQQGLLNRTALVVMSDHGMRWGEFRQTYQGKTEDRLPFVFIVLPKWWREKYPLAWGNLRRNSRSLTTPFDLHETLADLVNPHILQNIFLKKRIKIQAESPVPRGISWFLPVPEDRTCDMAQISNHWCVCHSSSNISLNDTGLQESVSFLIGELNSILSFYPPCAILNLKEIKDAKLWLDKSNGTTLMDYTVTIQTTPGDAIFESTVRYRTEDNSYKLAGTISRLNAYGKQSACVDEFNMRLYCYCL